MAVREARLTGEAHAVAAMRRVLDVMREETTAPIVNPQRSLGGLIGGEAKLVDATGRNDLSSNLMGAVRLTPWPAPWPCSSARPRWA